MSDYADVERTVHKVYGMVEMRPHQIRRDQRRGGRTTEAAKRLAGIRLSVLMRSESLVAVDDVEYATNDDFIRDRRQVAAVVRCVSGFGLSLPNDIRIPKGSAVLRIPFNA